MSLLFLFKPNIAFLAFVGFEAAAPLGEETNNPKRNIPRAVVFSAIGVGLFYVLASYSSVMGSLL